ncbi:SDR family NAD(P)-dependent oxidoreductase [Flexivirga caeni]|uniref:SDR family NAD(P)-dependent oxidoreductase n=1 Tax=Flexivirga caeni TaxID=2294115 RepID=A0A3M9M2S8_9MICO|nr:SDR family NAD(P)-dependent oxidoreductase [Flexivirga caeni]RNI19891.1 SDR family NAD(P)-dependent oxidoreductase [Flexivirga caeni]
MGLLATKSSCSYAAARVLVTGGCSGLGQALVKLLVADAARVLVGDVHAAAPEGSLPPGVDYLRLDVSKDEDWDAARNWVESTYGGLDVLINNAGIAAGGRIDVADMDEWRRIVDINLLGVARGCHTFVPMMKQQGSGQIVNTASLAGLVHAPAMASYNAVKAGVVAISETLRSELAPSGITVSVICPSFFRTNLAESFGGKDVDMEASGTEMITKAPRSADQVAAVAFAGMKAGKFIILTDRDGHIAYAAKRFARPVYDRAMLTAGKRVGKGTTPVPPALDKLRARFAKPGPRGDGEARS